MAYLGAILPRHPFDYIYNHMLRHWLNKPELPPSTNQKRFACGMATPWLAGTIYLFYIGQSLAAYILGGSMIVVSGLVSTTDICIPSIIYNFIYQKKST